jgi:lysophospholipase L1-like esterase
MIAAALVAAAVLLSAAVFPGSLTAARGDRCGVQRPGGSNLPPWAKKRRATMLVDSVLLGGFTALRARRPCWQVVKYGRPALMVRAAVEELRQLGRPVAPLVIVGLGYNSLWERRRRHHAYWAARFDREAKRLLRTLHHLGASQVVWVTLREPTVRTVPPHARGELDKYSWYFPYVNGRLRYLDRRRDDLALANWKAASDRPGLTYDSIHLNPAGAALMARTIWQSVANEARDQAS